MICCKDLFETRFLCPYYINKQMWHCGDNVAKFSRHLWYTSLSSKFYCIVINTWLSPLFRSSWFISDLLTILGMLEKGEWKPLNPGYDFLKMMEEEKKKQKNEVTIDEDELTEQYKSKYPLISFYCTNMAKISTWQYSTTFYSCKEKRISRCAH